MHRWNLLIAAPFLITAAWAQSDWSAVQETHHLNRDQAERAAQSNARYDAQTQQYQQQMRQWQAQQARYDVQREHYQDARDRYAAERARYRKGEGPSRYEHLRYVTPDDLMGAPLQADSGREVGHIDNIAWGHDGHVYAVRATLNDGSRHVWLDGGDLKYDTADRRVVTGLARHDLYAMAKDQD